VQQILAAEDWEVDVLFKLKGTRDGTKTWKVLAEKGDPPPQGIAYRGRLLHITSFIQHAPQPRVELKPKIQKNQQRQAKAQGPAWISGWKPAKEEPPSWAKVVAGRGKPSSPEEEAEQTEEEQRAQEELIGPDEDWQEGGEYEDEEGMEEEEGEQEEDEPGPELSPRKPGWGYGASGTLKTTRQQREAGLDALIALTPQLMNLLQNQGWATPLSYRGGVSKGKGKGRGSAYAPY
jgi:hypothetical protein